MTARSSNNASPSCAKVRFSRTLARVRLLFALLLCFSAVPVQANEGAFDSWLHDQKNEVGIHQLLQGYAMQPMKSHTASFGRRDGTLWLKAEVPAHPGDDNYTLEISYPHLRELDLFWVSKGELIATRQGGYHVANGKDLPCRGFCFLVPDAGGAPLTLYLAIRSDSPILVPMHFHDRVGLQWHTRTSHILLGVFYGTFAVMLLFNLFLYFSTRAKEYLYYGAYLASLCVWVASHDGTLRDYVLPFDSWANDYRFHFLVTLVGVVAGGMFSQSFLNTRLHAPRCDVVLTALIGAGGLSIVWLLIDDESFWPPTVNVLTLLLSATVITSAILELRRGVMMARFFLVAWVSVVTGSVLWVLTLVGILPYLKGAAFYVHVGCFFETILLSMALGDRINHLQDERNRLQNLAKQRLEETNRTLEISNRFKDEFLSTVSHELRTPMNGVIGSTELLRMTTLTEEQNSYLNNVNRSSQNMMRLIEDILTYTQIEANRYVIDSKAINFTQFFEDLCSQFRARAQSQQLTFSSHIAQDVPRYLEGDAAKLKLVVHHLLDNACKFTDQGGIKVSACAVSTPANKPDGAVWLRISISDTGCGVPKHMHDTVFELFRQADGTMTRKQGGLGIGLALCKRITVLMGGILEFHSDVQRGTDVHLYLPFKPAVAPVQNVTPIASSDIASHAGKTIMVVEDNQVNRLVLEGILRKLGYGFISAVNGREAVEMLKTTDVDLILMDCQMPVMDGYEATRVIRASGRTSAQLPIVAVTANSNPGDRETCIECGMNDFLAKPYTQRDISNALDYWLSDRKQAATP